MIAVADTSGLLALFNRSDPEHFQVRRAAQDCGLVVVTALSLTEVHQVATIRADRRAADIVLAAIVDQVEKTRFAIAETTPALVRASLAVRGHYGSLDLDLADAMVVAVAAEYRTDTVVTLDRRDFRALRPLTPHRAFRLLPDDWTSVP